ncbi:MAG TPA: hemolysin III family protein [Rhizomicrobium sp.]|nr:hemolysin III family protein [Rhizomicrobium sp.]
MTTLTEKAERIYSHHENFVDSVIHVAGMLFAVNAAAWLLLHVGVSAEASVTVYCLGLLAMIFASGIYNMAPESARPKQLLRRIDHAAIFIMIAATYTPFAVNRVGAPYGTTVLIAIWVCASIGVALKVLFPRRLENTAIALYLAMGWMVVFVLKPLAASVAAVDFWLLIGGGVVYSAGVAFYVIERIPFHKAIWHGFVLVAAVLHFSAVAMEFTA